MKRKSLDKFFSTLRSEIGKLKVCGWGNPDHEGIQYVGAGGGIQTLTGWIKCHLPFLKEGGEFKVCWAIAGDTGYSTYSDKLSVRTEKVKDGVLCTLIIERNEDENSRSYAGDYKIETWSEEQSFILVFDEYIDDLPIILTIIDAEASTHNCGAYDCTDCECYGKVLAVDGIGRKYSYYWMSEKPESAPYKVGDKIVKDRFWEKI